MSKVMPITSALVAATFAVAPGALAQDSTNSPWPTVGRDTTVFAPGTGGTNINTAAADSTFIRKTVDNNLLEVRLGELAQTRAADSAVKDFGRRMASEHGSINQQWTTLARNSRVTTGTDLDPAGRQAVARLEGLSGTAFDQAYMSEMVRGHEQNLSTFKRMRTSARSPEVKQLATSGVTTIQQHLTLARQISSRVGTSTTAVGGPAGPPTTNDTARRRTTTDSANRSNPNNADKLRGEDRAFVENILQAHLMHVQMAEMAQGEAKRDETRRLANRIQKDFSDWGQRWRALAERKDLKPPNHLGKHHQDKVDKLKKASKQDFDRTYATIVVKHLEAVVPYFEKEGQALQSASARRLAKDELPVVREDLNQARRLLGQASAQAESKEKEKGKQ